MVIIFYQEYYMQVSYLNSKDFSMNKMLVMILLVSIFGRCKKTKTLEQKQQKTTKSVNRELEYNIDKLVFISYIEKTPLIVVENIIGDYCKQYYDPDKDFDKAVEYQEVIDSISDEYNLSSHKVASILPAYIYEVRTKEEMGEAHIEQLQEPSCQKSNYNRPISLPTDQYI